MVKLCGVPIQWKDQVKYLRNIISCDLSDAYDIKAKPNVFISQVNTLNNKFSGVTCNVRGKLLQSYCCVWYGFQTWDFHRKMAQRINIEWNKAVRRTLRTPYNTYTRLLCT